MRLTDLPTLKLSDLPRRMAAAVERVDDHVPNDAMTMDRGRAALS